MKEVGGGPGTGGWSSYGVVADSLVAAAYDVSTTADLVRGGSITDLARVDLGHAGLQDAIGEFTSRWETGADLLIRRQHDIAERLTAVARSYVEEQATAAAAYGGLSGGLSSGGADWP